MYQQSYNDRACAQKIPDREAVGTGSTRSRMIAPSVDRGQGLRLVMRSASAGCPVPHCRCLLGTCRTHLLRARLVPELRAGQGGHP